MTVEQRIRAINLLNMVKQNPEMARDLGIEVRQKLAVGGKKPERRNNEKRI